MPLLPGTRASRRSTAAIFDPATVLLRWTGAREHSPLSGQHLRCPSSNESQPSKAAPSSGADRDRASWDEVTSLACRRRTLLRQIDVSR